MFRIKRIYDPPSADDGRRILVDRLWPRGMTRDEARLDEWLKEIAPTDELRKSFCHDPAKWTEFRTRYREELKGHGDLLERLRDEAQQGIVTLLFAAKEAERNNAVVLLEMLNLPQRHRGAEHTQREK